MLAFDLQSSLIPAQTPDLPGWEFAAWWQPAREVSGDFYDFVDLPGALGLVLGDVADKGMPAAMFMALTRSTIRASLSAGRSPAESLTTANRLICADSKNGMFVTLFYAALDPGRRSITYVNCGHNPPLLAHRGQDNMEELKRTGLSLRFDADFEYGEASCQLEPGDLLVIYTDGVTEAFNGNRQQFGKERLRALMMEFRDQSAQEVLEQLQLALRRHIGETPQSDDITAMVVRCVPPTP